MLQTQAQSKSGMGILIATLFFLTPTPQVQADDAEAEAIAAIQKMGGSVRRIALNTEDREVAFHLTGLELTDKGLAHVARVKNVAWLNLRGTTITSAGLVHLKGLTSLTRLHLERTAVDDAGMVHLKGLINLEYLNLYGTKVTDKSLVHLEGLKKLNQLYVWQTKVTDKGVAQLREALPNLTVVQGVDFSKVTSSVSKPKEGLKWVPAGDTKPPKSSGGGLSVQVTFENRTKRTVKLHWVSFGGPLKQYGTLKPGEKRQQNSYNNHTWVITDEKDKPLGHFTVGAQDSLAVISLK